MQQEVRGSLELTGMRLAVTLPNTQEKHVGLTTHLPSTETLEILRIRWNSYSSVERE